MNIIDMLVSAAIGVYPLEDMLAFIVVLRCHHGRDEEFEDCFFSMSMDVDTFWHGMLGDGVSDDMGPLAT